MKKKLILLLLLLSSLALAQTHTAATKEDSNIFLNFNQFTQGLYSGNLAFANLSGLVGFTNFVYITDGTPGAVCTGGGSGTFAFYVNGVWTCPLGVSTPILPTSSPYWFADWEGSPFVKIAVGGSAGQFGTGVANGMNYWMFKLGVAASFNTLRFRLNSAVSSSTIGIGLYDKNCNRLLHWDSISGASATNVSSTPTGGALTIQPGLYYWGFGFSTNSVGAPLTDASVATDGSETNNMPYNTGGTIRAGTGSNAMSAGVVPATCGTLTGGLESFLPYWTVEP